MKLYPDDIQHFDGFEYHPCTLHYIGDQEIVEQCEPEEAEFWSVYVRLIEGGLSCIADFDTEQECIEFIRFLEKIIEKQG